MSNGQQKRRKYGSFLFAVAIYSACWQIAPSFADEKPPKHREVPNYEQREERPTTAGEAALWVPRVLLFPAYLVTEYLFRAPLNWLGRAAELNKLPFVVIEFFTFGEDRRFGLFPTVLIDFGFRSSFGAHFYMKRFFAENNKFIFRVAFGGSDWFRVHLTDRITLSDTSRFEINARYQKRPDFVFHGIGAFSQRDRFRYWEERSDAWINWEKTWDNIIRLYTEVAFRNVTFADGQCCGDPGIQSGINSGVFPAPPRFQGGYSALLQRASVVWGKRPSRTGDRSGGRVEFDVEHAFDFTSTRQGNWLLYGGAISGYFDVTGKYRVFSLTLDTRLSSDLGGNPIPFTELPSLGGNRPLPGFVNRRLVGLSSIAASLEYLWPIAVYLDGTLHFSVGNVFGKDLSGFRLGALRKSFGLGFQASAGGNAFGLLAALGSDTFENGGNFNEFRLVLRFASEL